MLVICPQCNLPRQVCERYPAAPKTMCRSCAQFARARGPTSKASLYFTGTQICQWRRSAAVRNIPWLISKEYLDELYECQGGRCAYTGKILGSLVSLDRIDSSQPYQVGNCQLVLIVINDMKGVLSSEDFILLCEAVLDNESRKLKAPISATCLAYS